MRRPVALGAIIAVVLIYIVYSSFFLCRYDEYLDSRISFHGKIQDIKETEYGISLFLRGKIEGEKGRVGIVCYLEKDEGYAIGQKIRVEGIMCSFPKATNYGQSDLANYYQSLGYDYMMDDERITELSGDKSYLKDGLHKFKKCISNIIDEYYHNPYKAIIKGMLVGDKKGMDEEIKDMYAYGGIAHILSISGLHISIIGGVVYFILRKIKCPALAEITLSFCLLVGYGLMVGLSASIIRALCMYIYRRVGKMLRQGYDLPTSLCLAALAVAILRPYIVFQVGFNLSFLSVGALIFVYPIWNKIMDRHKQIIDMFLCGFSINICILPFIINTYYGFSPYGILVNLLVVPSVSAVLFSAFIVVLAHLISFLLPMFLWPLIITVSVWFGEGILGIYNVLLSFFMSLPGGMIIVGHRGTVRLIIYYSLLISLVIISSIYLRKMYIRFCLLRNYRRLYENNEKRYLYLTKQNHRLLLRFRICQCVVATLMMMVLFFNLNTEKKVTMLDVGQGEGIYIEINNRTFFVDGGSTSESKISDKVIEPYLMYEGCTKIDGWFLTHGDKDHVSGFLDICEKGNVKIDKVFVPKLIMDEMDEVTLAGLSAGAEIIPLKSGDVIEGENYVFKVISPSPKVKYEDNNRASLVMLLTIDDTDILLTGDAASEAEQLCINNLDDIDVLKVGHHGSKFSTSIEFLRDMNPKIALISAGLNNSYGHPNEETLERLSEVEAKIYRTDMQGCIMINFSGKEISVTTFCE